MADPLDETLGALVGELDRRFPYAAALVTGATGVRVGANGREQTAEEVDPSRGVVVTVYDGSTFAELASGDLDPDRLARSVRAWAGALVPRAGGAPPAARAAAGRRHFATQARVDPGGVPLAEKVAHVAELQAHAQALDPRVVRATARYTDRIEERRYLDAGSYLTQRVARVHLAVVLMVSDGRQPRYHFVIRGGTGGYELATLGPDELGAAGQVAVRLLEAGRVEPGEYDVLTDPSVSGTIAHECFGHGVELDLFPKGRARSAQYLDRRVAAPGVHMFDDPTVPGAYGSYFFDDEGQPATATQILRDGVFVAPIGDLTSATFAGRAASANGRRQDFTRKAYARMSNTFFGRGGSAPGAMLAGLERGIYLHQAESGMEDPMGWGVQVTAHYGEEVVDGRPTGRLFAPVGVSGYVPDLLGSISAVGDDFALDPAMCGKGHKEYVPVSSGGPHLRLKARLS